MSEKELKLDIQKAIKDFSNITVQQASIKLFNTLGYKSERKSPFQETSYQYFKDKFIRTDSKFNEEKAYIEEWKSIDLLFQLTDNEISEQLSQFDTKQVDNTIIEAYLFFSIELNKSEYTRTQLANITREVNKVFLMPVLIVFKHGDNITLSVINRRLNKKDSQKDVLEKVTVIKDISIVSPHRAHIEILFDLSFSELLFKYQFTNFVELHNAWQKTLNTKELNDRFYKELSNWYFWALKEVHFPTTNWATDKNSLLKEEEKVKEHNAKNLIRLLTRLLFVWFIKEKSLIPEELFDINYIKENLLKDFEPNKKKGFDYKTQGSKYYRAILQNLFFATLNQTVGKREFRKEGQQMNVTNLMRYESYFKDPEAFIEMVENIVPFMNGGLFECLDSPDPLLKGKNGGDIIVYEDGFSDRKDNTICVPDYIFFSKNEHADLSEELGDTQQNDVMVNGLINILKSYKFTVTENTPIEEDIALDPELLGRVFENLLASYNPETKTTARKQTGSFYTPREIVNYMVDESLKAYLKEQIVIKSVMNSDDAEIALDFLIGYNDKEHLFDEKQSIFLINAIDNCKILDPACGSGAFPMGILHKLVHILHKLDPNNKLWKEKQIEKANLIDDSEIREKLIEDIETAFNSNELDYGRKLYLIENCIYGVDIQPIATQISKLRFFISLVVDQKVNKKTDNFGIRPLPNLETKFVTANTLIGIEKPPKQLTLFDLSNIQELEKQLKDIRHRLFSAKTPSTKKKLRDEDRRIREEMSKILEEIGWSNKSAQQLAKWDPYNQNISTDWFDQEWMFGIEKGFDVVIGNPPYIRADNPTIAELRKQIMDSKQYETLWEKWDLYVAFLEKSFKLLKDKGVIDFIIPDAFIASKYAEKPHKYYLENSLINRIDFLSEIKVFDAAVKNIIIEIKKDKNSIHTPRRFKHVDQFNNKIVLPTKKQFELSEYTFKIKIEKSIIGNFQNCHEWGKICYVSYGLRPSSDERYWQGEFRKEDLISSVKDQIHCKAYIEGKWIKKYQIETIKYLEWGTDRSPSKLVRPTFPELFIYPKILRGRMTDAVYDDSGLLCNDSCFVSVLWEYFTDISNLSINNSIRKDFQIKGDKFELQRFRNKLEANSKNFDLKYLLAILNSKFGLYFLKSVRRSQIGFYPDDLKKLPIKDIKRAKQEIFSAIVNSIIEKKKNYEDTRKEEQEIDQLVYKLYDLTEEEITLIEKES